MRTLGRKGLACHDAGSMSETNRDVGPHINNSFPSNFNSVSQQITPIVSVGDQKDTSILLMNLLILVLIWQVS
jgi:hypothetical protein